LLLFFVQTLSDIHLANLFRGNSVTAVVSLSIPATALKNGMLTITAIAMSICCVMLATVRVHYTRR